MAELIPLLSRSPDPDQSLLPAGFVDDFVALHEHDWGRAQSHWERIVARVLDTDAVDPHATGRRAIRQAVQATVILLARSDLRGRCPLCVRGPGPTVPASRGAGDD